MQILEKTLSTRAEGETIRPLGVAEQLYYLIDATRPNHFTMVAELTGATTVDQWRTALNCVYQQTPLLASKIVTNSSGELVFVALKEELPLRVIRDEDSDWKAIVADEQDLRFDPSRGPLGRATLLYRQDRSTLILSIYQAASDGLGSIYLLQNILQALAGESSTLSSKLVTVEDFFEQVIRQPVPTQLPPSASLSSPIPVQFRPADAIHPSIDALALSSSLTERLRDVARSKGTTIQGALGDALVRALIQLSPARPAAMPRIASAIDLRSRIAHGNDEFGLCFTGGVIALDFYIDDFWEMACAFKDKLRPMEQFEGIAALIGGFCQLAKMAESSPDTLAEITRSQFGFEGTLSNMGIVRIPTMYSNGKLELTALWGPSTMTGYEGEHMVGVVTVHGRIHLLHTTYTATTGLLHAMETILETAVSA